MREIFGLREIVGKKAIVEAYGENFRGIIINGTITLNVNGNQVCIPFYSIRGVKVIE